ncbi:hypothetical protein IEQ34_016391 [Dendrobium chrysotoxum]|uniref:Uncharacterized protein n=1 Tax=Dendrobium chrysotoxum TaxID=161865 RepID=A0AAV7GE66_DENCH|nr:hypothetical protein IEQ34_016391 [Dendrobium chrysotoxum]
MGDHDSTKILLAKGDRPVAQNEVTCGVSLSQFSCKDMPIIMGLIVFFRYHGACLSRMDQLTYDTQGHITFRSKWLNIRTQDPPKSWTIDSSSCRMTRICWKNEES